MDKEQHAVIMIQKKTCKDSIIVGYKNDALNALKDMIWTNYAEKVLSIITIKLSNKISSPRVMTQDAYPFHIDDVPLPQYRTGSIYMIMSVRSPIIYFDQTLCLINTADNKIFVVEQ